MAAMMDSLKVYFKSVKYFFSILLSTNYKTVCAVGYNWVKIYDFKVLQF